MLPFYEYANSQYHISTTTRLSYPAHLHLGVEMLYVKKGSVLTQYGDEQIVIKKGQLIVLFPNTVHAYLSCEKHSLLTLYLYRNTMQEDISNILTTKVPANFIFEDIPDDVKILLDYLSLKNENDNLVTKLYFELILAKLFPLMGLKEKDHNLPEDLLISVLIYIQNNFSENISLDILSKKFGVSKYKISRLFTYSINVSLTDYVNTLRIEQAKTLLKKPDSSVISTAFNCGFESQQTFNRVFKKLTGITPKEYKKLS
ncbi:MAG: AraC family transcriptional regulator [Clostridia bacterium]